MRIVEQSIHIGIRSSIVTAEYPTEFLFQVFVKGRLQNKGTYKVEGENIDFGFDCLVPGDNVQLFFFIP